MLDFKKMNKIGEDIYVFKNFLTKTESIFFTQKAIFKKENEWNNPKPSINWMKYTNPDEDVEIIRKKIIDLILDKDLFLGPSLSLTKMTIGGTWGEHSDDHDYLEIVSKSKMYKEGDPYDLKPNSLWGLVVYFNDDFIGGEIYYPNQKIIYKPCSGDLIIHSSREHCKHGVKEVLDGIRITHSNNMYKMIKVPKKNGS